MRHALKIAGAFVVSMLLSASVAFAATANMVGQAGPNGQSGTVDGVNPALWYPYAQAHAKVTTATNGLDICSRFNGGALSCTGRFNALANQNYDGPQAQSSTWNCYATDIARGSSDYILNDTQYFINGQVAPCPNG